jgi:phage FluMu gp28-like protein
VELTTLKSEFAAEFINIEEAAQVEGATWEPFQIQFLNNIDRLTADVKARQIAWSFTAALDAVTDGIIHENTPHIFVSVNQDEASEKIRYCRAIINAIDEPVRPKLIRDSATMIELKNGSRYISHPMRPVRGKPQARVYLDEMAHYPSGMDRQIYTAALPATTKGGYMRIGSSPLGAKGLFWEIITEGLRKWPGFKRQILPWWTVKGLCRDVEKALLLAPDMLTEQRVRTFGTPALIEIFENMFLEDFQQEYECAWVDEATSWITWEVINSNQVQDLIWLHAKSVGEAYAMIPEIQEQIRLGAIEPVLAGGIDIGRHHDFTEMMVVGKSTMNTYPVRFSISLDKVPFDEQQACFNKVVSELPFTQVLIDQNGIGAQLAENMQRTGRAMGVDFTNPSKELWAVEARIQAERGATPLPVDRDLAYQIHSIKKTVTASKNNVFDAERNEKHHADKFWAWALALWAASPKSGSGFVQIAREAVKKTKEEKEKHKDDDIGHDFDGV